jgi:hypothetical protein
MCPPDVIYRQDADDQLRMLRIEKIEKARRAREEGDGGEPY